MDDAVSRSERPVTAATQDWQAIEQDNDFRALVRTKRNFILPATVFFLVYYFAFLIIVGYVPEFANASVLGNINVAYLFALSQFIVTWLLMGLYVWRAGKFDAMAQRILEKVRGGQA
ncbi:uncharacterized membrane protein (DUF485 family) [Thermosporothrix hazakensis]|jgi:uncharacterized membrane protein (DUF485 family)|uniref:Uncharacterized membrane protein (DUF485 family) n=2 Tax=Thermosporothrix TaxID=768650 RepID=A0A326U9G0_THEHA|nr:DUF485 domain-containing protein [Thermosporothrix hazakensis]PZW32836.1 uncharacterized membrane protein (DUF485 family) [Thermosporothrix hazakensis]BBH90817.1 membrane protein [Thermosporothrix sp. COM3]GCE48867.1 membrane protein [Thermosporothrix hazakensis]